jgi:hypothetical protein
MDLGKHGSQLVRRTLKLLVTKNVKKRNRVEKVFVKEKDRIFQMKT